MFTGAELALVPIANITVDHVSPNADVVFLEGYNLLTAFPGLSPVCNAYQKLAVYDCMCGYQLLDTYVYQHAVIVGLIRP